VHTREWLQQVKFLWPQKNRKMKQELENSIRDHHEGKMKSIKGELRLTGLGINDQVQLMIGDKTYQASAHQLLSPTSTNQREPSSVTQTRPNLA
jgi:hypothetical protein